MVISLCIMEKDRMWDVFEMYNEYIGEINIGLNYLLHFQGDIEGLQCSPYLNLT